VYFSTQELSFAFGLFIVLWSVGFIELWRLRERQLSIYWNVKNISKARSKHNRFRGERKVTDQVTHEKVDFFPAWKRWLRRLMTIPILLLSISVFATVQVLIIAFQLLMQEVYSGPFHNHMVNVFIADEKNRSLIRLWNIVTRPNSNILCIHSIHKLCLCPTCQIFERVRES
jgi:hypothetical protein